MFKRVFGWSARFQRHARYTRELFFLGLAPYLFLTYVAEPRRIAGASMLPTMAVTGEFVIEDKISPRLNPPNLARGDLVCAISPYDPTKHICKRILGMPGDIICVDPTGEWAPSTEHVVIPKGHVWLIGDNASGSRDSRLYGPVSMSLIRGKVIARVLPWRNRTIFRNGLAYIDEEAPAKNTSITHPFEYAVLSNS